MNLTMPITLTYGLIVVLIITIMVTGFVVLLNKKVEMIYLMRPYTYAIEDRGYLLNVEKSEIEDKLNDLGLYDTEVEVDNQHCEFGDLIEFSVSGKLDYGLMTGFLEKELRTITYSYQREIYMKRITN